MTTSNYFPDVKVEIAFNAGYSTAVGSRTWTDVSSYVELAGGINITRGRGDEFGTTEPNKLSLTLDNRDGRFTAGKAGGAYYPNVKIGRPIRVTSTPVGGAASVRFLGYVDEWPTEWNGTDSYASAKIAASSRMARLGFGAELQSVSEAYLSWGPDSYWTLGDAEPATTAVNAIEGGVALSEVTGDPVFGVEVLQEAGTGVRFNGVTGGLFAAYGTTTMDLMVEGFCKYYSPASAGGRLVVGSGTGSDTLELGIDAGTDILYAQFGALSCGVATIATDEVFHFAVRCEYIGGGNTRLTVYKNGVSTATITGAHAMDTFNTLAFGYDVTADLAHVAVNADPVGLLARARTGLVLTGSTSGERIISLASDVGIPAAEISTVQATSTVEPFEVAGRTVLDAMRTVEATEGGVLFDARDNTLTFHGRTLRYNATSAFTIDVALQEVEAGMVPKLDRSALVNDVTATASDGTAARAINQTSIDDYGYARQTLDLAVPNSDAYQAAAWRVNTYGEPQPRIPALGVNLLPLTQARQDSLFALDVSSRITLSNQPTQAPATTADYHIEGYTENIGHESYTFDFNVSPTTGFDVWTIQDAVFGQYDAYPIAL